MIQEVKQKPVLVWVTNPSACEQIVRTGRELADKHRTELVVVSIQPTIRDQWEERTSELNKLHLAAKAVNAELTVVYSDNRMEAMFKTVRHNAPGYMLVGLRGAIGQGSFLDQLLHIAEDVPVYSVDTSGNMVRLNQEGLLFGLG